MIFLNEKKFNLQGPDWFAYYWHDMRNVKKIFSTCQHGGGSVMVRGAFSGNGQSSLAIMNDLQDSQKYINVLVVIYCLTYTGFMMKGAFLSKRTLQFMPTKKR